jgi:uncharacterized heparinase superfamily protein
MQTSASGSQTLTLASAELSTREHVKLALLALERARRGATARLHRSRLLRWRHRAPAAEDLLLAPPDLRAQDAGFADELADDSLGLAGSVVRLGGRSPFVIAAPSQAWWRELHSFAWLRHLDAAHSREAEALARKLAGEWIRRSTRRNLRHAWEPELVGRRILAWLSHAGLLLDRAKRRPYAALMRSLSTQITYLTASWRNAPDGYPRLVALIALVQADLCIAANERRLAHSTKLLIAELERQILPDGCHSSRNPWVLVELLLDLLPLRQCFAAQGKTPDPALVAAIRSMTGMLCLLRLGDGMLARFNGAATVERDTLATVLAHAQGQAPPLLSNPPSGYMRLERGSTIVVADVGAPPPLQLAGAACAGCLSFELSTGGELLLVNAGAPGHGDTSRRAIARATASHNTLCVGEQSSSKLIRNARLEREVGGAPLRHPDRVTSRVRQRDGGIELEARHDGYLQRFSLLHTRTLHLRRDGSCLEGVDRLHGAQGPMRFAWDVPFAIHFHLHPDAEVHAGTSVQTAELLLGSGEHWRLTATGAALSIEESIYVADARGPRAAQQAVLRGVCGGASRVAWRLERLAGGLFSPLQGARSSLRETLSAVPAFDAGEKLER